MKKIYVQDILDHKEDMLRRILYREDGPRGRIYICGSTRMSKDVLRVMARHVAEFKNLAFQEAEKEIDALIKDRRICMEAWN